jgi:hypothetical protein
LENCYGLTDADFEHEEVVGDATARALETNKGSVVVQEEKEMVAV